MRQSRQLTHVKPSSDCSWHQNKLIPLFNCGYSMDDARLLFWVGRIQQLFLMLWNRQTRKLNNDWNKLNCVVFGLAWVKARNLNKHCCLIKAYFKILLSWTKCFVPITSQTLHFSSKFNFQPTQKSKTTTLVLAHSVYSTCLFTPTTSYCNKKIFVEIVTISN